MDKFYSCAVVSQRPTQFKFKYQEYMTSCKRLKKRLHDVFMELYRRGVRRYYVGGALGVDLWAGEILLEMRWQEECPELKIVLVYPFPGHDERWDPKSRERLRRLKENCDQFVMGSRGVGAQGYKERTVYMVQCADCLVAVYLPLMRVRPSAPTLLPETLWRLFWKERHKLPLTAFPTP